jgi:hypothetical protein
MNFKVKINKNFYIMKNLFVLKNFIFLIKEFYDESNKFKIDYR